MPSPIVLSPGISVHIQRERSKRCFAAILLNAPNPQVATIRNMEDDSVTRGVAHSTSEHNAVVTWHTLEECRAMWPAILDAQTERERGR